MELFKKFKTFRKNNPRKLFETFMTLTVVSLITMGAVFDSEIKEITVLHTNAFEHTLDYTTFKTRTDTVSEFLAESGLEIGEDNVLKFSLSDTLENGDTLEIRKARAITIYADGSKRNVVTSQNNVGKALLENGIKIGVNDWATPGFESPITDGMTITLHRINIKDEVCTEEFYLPEQITTDDTMYKDEKIVHTPAVAGKKEITYKVFYKGEEEAYREVITETVISEATPAVITVGTKERPVKPTATKGGRTFTYSRKFTVKATAYDTSLEENGGYTKTAMGLTPGFGIVAVDPRVIPLGTRLYIESTDDGQSWTYGFCIAGDTGGAIKGNRVDLCYNTQYECIKFGRRNATVYVLD